LLFAGREDVYFLVLSRLFAFSLLILLKDIVGFGDCYFEVFKDVEMVLLLPLGKDQIVFFEVLPVQVLRLTLLNDWLAVLVDGRLGVQVPPPPASFEELVDQSCIVTSAHETLVVREILSLEVQLDAVCLIDCFVERLEHLLFGVAEEGFAS